MKAFAKRSKGSIQKGWFGRIGHIGQMNERVKRAESMEGWVGNPDGSRFEGILLNMAESAESGKNR